MSAKDNSKEPAKAPLQGCEGSLSPEERARVDQFLKRAKNNPTGPRLKVTGNTIALNSVEFALLGQALGTGIPTSSEASLGSSLCSPRAAPILTKPVLMKLGLTLSFR